jgi:hypothetical protein
MDMKGGWEYKEGYKLGQSTPYACIKLSQWNLVLM